MEQGKRRACITSSILSLQRCAFILGSSRSGYAPDMACTRSQQCVALVRCHNAVIVLFC